MSFENIKVKKIENLCLAGGVALNCVANGKILKEKIFKDIWIQPASGDAGSSLGCALDAYYSYFKENRDFKVVKNSLEELTNAAKTDENLIPHIITCVENNCTLGEIIIALKTVFGEYLE